MGPFIVRQELKQAVPCEDSITIKAETDQH